LTAQDRYRCLPAASVAKAKATRQARSTKGTVQKKVVKGNVDAKAITTAINQPIAMPAAPAAPKAAASLQA
jgi:hypothetical protein